MIASASGSVALGLVVIGDDEVEAERARPLRCLGAANAAVHRDDHVDLVGMQPVDRRRLQSVAVAQPLRNEMTHLAAEHLQRAAEDDSRGDAVDVVVAVDGDPLAARQRQLEARHRPFHVGQEKRVVQVIERRVQESVGNGGIAEAAQAQEPCDCRMDAERRRQLHDGVFIARLVVPEERLHLRAAPA